MSTVAGARGTPAGAGTLSRARRYGVLAICCLSLFIVGLDVTIVNVALPSLGHDLHASVSGLQWTMDAYSIVLGSLLMLSGSTADRLGRRRTFQVGLVLFTLGSFACSIAPSLLLLVIFRMVQAVGGSMLNPVAMSIIRNTFHEPRERAQAIGLWGATMGVSMALGPVLGGLLVQDVGWRSIFWVNIPIGVSAIVLTALFVPESRAPRPRRIDPAGQVLMIVLLASLTAGIIEGPNHGWTSGLIVGLFVLALGALIGIIVVEPSRPEPLIDLRFFRSAPFSGATVIAIAAFVAMGGFLFLNTLYLQGARGLSPLAAGLDTLPMAALTVAASPVSGWLVGRIGARFSLVLGGLAIVTSGWLLTDVALGTSFVHLFVAYVVFGLGFGFVNPPITNAAVSGMPASQAGVASAVASTSRQIGQAIGVALVGALSAAGAVGTRIGRSFAVDSHPGWWVVAGSGVLVFFLGLGSTTRWARGTAERTGELFEEDRPPLSPALVRVRAR